jgi:hypothetical protein
MYFQHVFMGGPYPSYCSVPRRTWPTEILDIVRIRAEEQRRRKR